MDKAKSAWSTTTFNPQYLDHHNEDILQWGEDFFDNRPIYLACPERLAYPADNFTQGKPRVEFSKSNWPQSTQYYVAFSCVAFGKKSSFCFVVYLCQLSVVWSRALFLISLSTCDIYLDMPEVVSGAVSFLICYNGLGPLVSQKSIFLFLFLLLSFMRPGMIDDPSVISVHPAIGINLM